MPSFRAWRNPTEPTFPSKILLLPPSLGDWLPEDHLAYFVSDVVDQLDLSAIESVYEEDERGQPPYHPRMMTKLLIYGYCVGVFSSRRIAEEVEGGCGFSGVGGGERTGFPNDLGLSEAASGVRCKGCLTKCCRLRCRRGR